MPMFDLACREGPDDHREEVQALDEHPEEVGGDEVSVESHLQLAQPLPQSPAVSFAHPACNTF